MKYSTSKFNNLEIFDIYSQNLRAETFPLLNVFITLNHCKYIAVGTSKKYKQIKILGVDKETVCMCI